MTAPWMTEDALALVKEMATRKASNNEIAYEVTKAFGIFVNGNMIAGRVSRMPEIPSRFRSTNVPKRDPFEWAPQPRPAWGTADADAIVLKAKVKFISSFKIGQYFSVSDNMVTAAVRRARHAQKIASYNDDMRVLAQYQSTEWPVVRIARLIQLYERGLTYAEIREDPQMCVNGVVPTHATVQKKAERLKNAGLITPRDNPIPGGARAARNAASRHAMEMRELVEKAIPRKDTFAKLKVPTSVAAMRCGLTLAGLGKVVCCAWSGCNEAADGKWCGAHGTLLRAPATEISQRLDEWK